MPIIKTVIWNIENFGSILRRRGNYTPICNFIVQTLQNADADIFCLQELVPLGAPRLDQLLRALHNAFPDTHWYYDFLPGSLAANAAPPYNTAASLGYTSQGRREGYAVFWKQNIAKFVMQVADPIDPALFPAGGGAMLANTQSFGARARSAPLVANQLAANIAVLAGPGTYSLPVNSTVGPLIGIVRGGAVLANAGPGQVIAAALQLNPGDIIPTGTVIGAGGLTLTAATLGVNPIVVPGGYVLTAALTLPAVGTVLAPMHALSLVLSGRSAQANGDTINFNAGPGGPANAWEMLHFADGIGTIYSHPRLTRRPATCTIRVTSGLGAAQELIPITFYHTPLAAPANVGMAAASLCRSLYQAYDHGTSTYQNNARAIIGGDFNQRLNPAQAAFLAFTGAFGAAGGVNGGAACSNAAGPCIRVNTPLPAPPYPAYPPMPVAPGPANVAANKSLIALRRHHTGDRILSQDPNHYRSSAYDNIFYRGFTAAQSPSHVFGDIYPLLDAVSGAAAPGGAANFNITTATIQAFQTVPMFTAPGVAVPAAPAAIPNVLVPARLLEDIQAGGFGSAVAAAGAAPAATPVVDPPRGAGLFEGPAPLPMVVTAQRRAAEFVKLFVSDHFPVLLELHL